MTPQESARIVALQIASNAVRTHAARIHKRTAVLFSDAIAIEAVQATLLDLESATPKQATEEEDLTNFDPGKDEAVPGALVAVARALSLVSPEPAEPPASEPQPDQGSEHDESATADPGEAAGHGEPSEQKAAA